MKLQIEKADRHGIVQVTLSVDTGRKPILIGLDEAKLQLLVGLLTTARQSDKFTFSLEL